MIYLSYIETPTSGIATKIFNGFYDDTIQIGIPTPNIELTQELYQYALERFNNHENFTIDELVIAVDVPEQPSISWDIIRSKRNGLLRTCDFTQLPDYPGTNKSDWVSYRQLLRDIPQTYSTDINSIVWPTPPNSIEV